MDLFRSLSVPLYPASLIFVGLSALLLAFLEHFGFWGVIPAFFLVSWLFKYGYAMLEHVANGRFDAPVVSVDTLGPFEARPWVQTALAVCVYAAIRAIGGPGASVMVLASVLLLPASVAVLGTSSQLIDGFNPLALWRMLRGLGPYYLCVIAVIAALTMGAILAWRSPMWSMIRLALMELSVLAAFSFIGGAVYARRVSLGFEPRSSPERTQAKAETERRRRLQHFLDELFQFVNARQSQRAVQLLGTWLAQTAPGDLADDSRTIVGTVLQWHAERGASVVLRSLIGNLATAGKLALAMETLHTVLAQQADFTLDSEASALELARHARAIGQPRFALQILNRYEQRYPDPPMSEALTPRAGRALIARSLARFAAGGKSLWRARAPAVTCQTAYNRLEPSENHHSSHR
jgi:hypothetical protein